MKTELKPSKISKCRSCKKDIIWIEVGGKKIPVDAKPTIAYGCNDSKTYWWPVKLRLNHFVTCPDRDKWRKK